MWTLAQTRTNVGYRISEVSQQFWGEPERDVAINDAQRFIAGLTNGVPETVTGTVSSTSPSLTVTGKLLGEYAAAGKAADRALTFVPVEVADKGFPTWRTFTGVPRWVIAAPHEGKVYIAPTPMHDVAAEVHVSVLPADLSSDGDRLFGDTGVMEKYQSPLVNVAAAFLLLKERYDGDAERFWSFALNEMKSLGLHPDEVPPLREAASNG